MKKLIVTFALTMFSAQVANAAGGYYAGISAGPSGISSDVCDGLPIRCDFSDRGWKIFGGYQATKRFGLEISFVDFGEFTATGPGGTATIEISGFSFVGTGTVPVSERFGLFGKIGLFRWDKEERISGGGQSASIENDGTRLIYGLGAKVKATERVSVRVEWERFSRDNLNLLSAGIALSF